MEILVEDGRPRAAERSAMACRIAAVRWFAPPSGERAPARRVVEAVRDHAERLPLGPPPAGVSVLDGAQGRAWVRRAPETLGRPAWQALLDRRTAEARDALRADDVPGDHPLIVRSGASLLLRPSALPVPIEMLRQGLAGPADDRLPPPLVERLLDRVLWELASLLLWEIVAGRLGPNPFQPLLAIYEEGLYPLAFAADAVLLWHPAGEAEST